MTSPVSADPDTLYAAVDGRLASLGADEAVFFEARTGQSHVMTRDVAHAFELCQPFLTMREHVSRIMEAIPALKGQGAAIEKVLEMFIARGLMQTDAQFIAGFADAQESAAQPPISGLYLRAPADVAQLRSVLEALAAHAKRFGLAWPVYLVDLNADAAGLAARGEVLASFARDSAARTHHITTAHAEKLIAAVAQQQPEQLETLRWLLSATANSSGAARNLVVLLAAGTRYLFMDADTALPLLRHPEYAPGLYADTRALALRSFDNVQNARAAGRDSDTDPLAEHLAICGTALRSACALQPDAKLQRDSLHGVISSRAPWLHPERRVAFTAVGRVGRFALNDPSLPFQLGNHERAGMTATREAYLATYREPVLWHGTSHFGVGLGEHLLPLAFDASQLLPCTLPDARHASRLQVELLRLAQPESVDVDFPAALMQIAPGPGADDALGRPDSAQCLAGLAAYVAQDAYGTDPAHRLGILAAKLDDMAHASDEGLQRYLAEYLTYHRSGLVERMQQTHAAAGSSAPIYWTADLRAAVEAQGKALIAGEVPRLADWPQEADAATCISLFRAELRGLAAGLRAWPAAFAVAKANSAQWRDAL